MATRKNYEAKILLIDDQQANIDVLVEFLKIQGYTDIKFTTDSRKTEDLIKSFKPDIVLLDLLMPHVSGFDILEKMKNLTDKNTYLPVLVLTADITSESKRKALSLGASDFLTKPFDLIELQARINTHLQIRFKTEEIKEYAQRLEILNATKNKFFSVIAHDVNNPFSGIANFCKIILNQYDKIEKNEIKKHIEIINSTAENGKYLLSNLLKWAKSQTGAIVVEKTVFSATKVIEESFEFSKYQAISKQIKLTSLLENDISINSDKEMVTTILRNLVSNAVKFTPQKGTITVNVALTKDFVNISVTDTGIGICPDDIKKLFRIDSKLHSRKGTSNELGSGLGLILCKEFADKLEGEITVESIVSQGTVFCLKLPIN